MPDEATMLAAYAQTYPDETDRLIFADWLEERGDVRGSWLRDPVLASAMGPGLIDPAGLVVALDRSEEAIEPLRRLGRAALPALLIRFVRGYPAGRQRIRDLLDEWVAASPTLRGFVERLRSSQPGQQRATLAALAELGEEAAPLTPDIVACLRAGDPAVCQAVFATLAQCAGDVLEQFADRTPVLPDLLRLLAHPNEEHRLLAERLLEPLREAIQGDAEVGSLAETVLERTDPTNRAARIRRAMASGSVAERFAAVGEIRLVTPESEIANLLRTALADSDGSVRNEAGKLCWEVDFPEQPELCRLSLTVVDYSPLIDPIMELHGRRDLALDLLPDLLEMLRAEPPARLYEAVLYAYERQPPLELEAERKDGFGVRTSESEA